MSSNRVGIRSLSFWAILSIVIGNQIGSGAFNNPTTLAKFGYAGFIGLCIAGFGAIVLALVFAQLSKYFPKNGGPHAYVANLFGRRAGFFTAWIYWIVSWLSNAVLLSTIVRYASFLTSNLTTTDAFIIQVIVLSAITILNVIGINGSGKSDVILTTLKTIIFVLIPLSLLPFVKTSNFVTQNSINNDCFKSICNAILYSFFGFIGVESATTTSENVKNPSKTIPIAIILGTIVVATVYLINNLAIVGVIGFDKLSIIGAPYAEAIDNIFSGKGGIIIAAISIMVCFGTLNSWTFTSGQIAYVAHRDGFFGNFLGKTNKNGSPYNAVLLSSVGMIACLVLSQSQTMQEWLVKILDISVSIFLYIYLLCCIVFFTIVIRDKDCDRPRIKNIILSIVGFLFCILVLISNILYGDGFIPLLVTIVLILAGIPVYHQNRKTILQK